MYVSYVKYTSVHLLNSFLFGIRNTLHSSPVVALLRFLAQRLPQVEKTRSTSAKQMPRPGLLQLVTGSDRTPRAVARKSWRHNSLLWPELPGCSVSACFSGS